MAPNANKLQIKRWCLFAIEINPPFEGHLLKILDHFRLTLIGPLHKPAVFVGFIFGVTTSPADTAIFVLTGHEKKGMASM